MKHRITDEDIDRLLAARLRELSPGWERRVEEQLRAQRAGAAATRAHRRWWYAASLAVAAGLALMVGPALSPPPVPGDYETLFALEDSLAPAEALLDPTNRELCAELPLSSPNP